MLGWRLRKKITQTEAAEILGLESQGSYANIERNKRRPGPDTMWFIERAGGPKMQEWFKA